MSGIQITLDDNGAIERVNKILAHVPGGVDKAIAAASKRAGEQGKTKAGTFAAQEYTVSKGTFMGNVNIKLQVQDGFTLEFAGGVLPIEKFRSRDIRPRGTQTSEKRGQSSILHRVFGLSGGFVERVGTSRLPLEKKFGPSTGHMMQNDTVIEQMDKTISESFEKRIEVEINRILAGL